MITKKRWTAESASMPLRMPAMGLILCILALSACTENATWRSGDLILKLGSDGRIAALENSNSGQDVLAPGVDAPLVRLHVQGEEVLPSTLSVVDRNDVRVTFEDGHEMDIGIKESQTHLRFEIASISPADDVELVVWGPIPTTLDGTIGETVGVVQEAGFALGLQALNPRTLGGYPWNENDALPQLDIFESGDYSDLNPAGKRGVLYRVEAAKPDSFGSTLQAYTRRRDSDRVIPNRGYQAYVAPAFDDGGIVGSSIALFGAAAEDALATIGEIEIAAGLPHPMIDGQWGKQSRSASAAYLILSFTESNFDRALEVTKEAGLRYLYHPGPFETWGHFRLNPAAFPNGRKGLKRLVARAETEGIMVGVHTLSNFITPNDPYVAPVPDPRLARIGSSRLSMDVSDTVTEIPIEDHVYFSHPEKSALKASVIGEEIVRCEGLSDGAPWRLTDCERGAYGTVPAVHPAGAVIGKLDDHAYNVFLSNADLSIEMARNIAELFNETGLRQISFDGLEGNRSTGMGNYGEILFTTAWFDALGPAVREHYIADASRTSHYFWHIYSRMNWGEPWYAGFRESQTEYRLKNQAYFRRNLMPAMLGWFSMRPETSVEDIEWMLARSAGFDAGYGFVTEFDRLQSNGASGEILELLGTWEAARMEDAFTEEQKSRMQDIENEFHLARVDSTSWSLFPVRSLKFSVRPEDRQPGEPADAHWTFSTSDDERHFELVLTAVAGAWSGISITLDGRRTLASNVDLSNGYHLRYMQSGELQVYTDHWKPVRPPELAIEKGLLEPGSHTISMAWGPGDAEQTELRLELRIEGAPEAVRPR